MQRVATTVILKKHGLDKTGHDVTLEGAVNALRTNYLADLPTAPDGFIPFSSMPVGSIGLFADPVTGKRHWITQDDWTYLNVTLPDDASEPGVAAV